MMKLQDGYTNLEWSKKLKALWVRQESVFYWFPFGGGVQEWQLTKKILEAEDLKGWRYHEKNNKDFSFYSAFSVAELGVALPGGYHFPKKYKSGEWWCDYSSGCDRIACEGHDTEAHARAAMLCYLLENKIITVEEVNRRLAA